MLPSGPKTLAPAKPLVSAQKRSAPAAPLPAATPGREDWPGFLLTAVEFGLLVLVVRVLEIESQRFGQLMAWAWVGFVVNHFLPSRWRLPFFVAVSLWCLYV